MITTARAGAAAGLAGAVRELLAAEAPWLKLGMCDWSMRRRADLSALELARRIGLDGVEVSVGSAEDGLPLHRPAVQQAYQQTARKYGLAIPSLAMSVLNRRPLISEPRARLWVADTIEVARRLRRYADALSGRERLAVSAFAEALEVIPTTLAENTGMDPIDAISEMRSAHAKGEKWVGVNGTTNEVGNLADINVWEPMVVKTQAIKSATEAATMLLKIDDIIAVAKSKPPEPPRGGGGGGMGGMPPM